MDEPLKNPQVQPQTQSDPYTEELFQQIKEENITVDPLVWSLLTHVLGNRVYALNLILGDFLDTPKWILNAGSNLMIFLYKISGHKDKMYTIQERLQRALNNARMVKYFLKRLREATEKKAGF